MMDKQFLDIVLLITTIISGAILAFSTQIAEKYPKLKWIEKLVFKIPIALLLILITNYCSAEKERLSSEENQISQNKKDSIHQRREDSLAYDFKKQIDSSYNKSIKSSNEALAKYHLVIIDSLHTVASTINSKGLPTPQLSVAPFDNGKPCMYLSNEFNPPIFSIKFISPVATSNQINVNCYIVKEVNNYFWVLKSQNIFHNGFVLPGITTTCKFPVNEDILNEGELFIVLMGKFSNDKTDKKFIPYQQTYKFNFKENKLIGSYDLINYNTFSEYLRKNNL